MNATRALLLRHAESEAPDVWHGAESDVGLSPRGLRDACALAHTLAAEHPAAVISSPLRRAVETARPIAAACGVATRIEEGLRERRIGALCGLPFDGARGEWAETVRRWMVGETGYASEGAESFDDVRQRVLPIWNRLAEEYGSRTYVVVAHGAVITVVLLSLRLPLMAAGDLGCPNLAIHDLRQTQHGWTIGAPSEG